MSVFAGIIFLSIFLKYMKSILSVVSFQVPYRMKVDCHTSSHHVLSGWKLAVPIILWNLPWLPMVGHGLYMVGSVRHAVLCGHTYTAVHVAGNYTEIFIIWHYKGIFYLVLSRFRNISQYQNLFLNFHFAVACIKAPCVYENRRDWHWENVKKYIYRSTNLCSHHCCTLVHFGLVCHVSVTFIK